MVTPETKLASLKREYLSLFGLPSSVMLNEKRYAKAVARRELIVIEIDEVRAEIKLLSQD